MEIQITQSYLTALAELGTAEQQRITKQIEKLKRDPTTNGLNIEKISNGFISIRANQDIRVIAQYVGSSMILHYIDHHKEAYDWANKRKLLADKMDNTYRVSADSTVEKEQPVQVTTIPLPSKPDYGKLIFNQLISLGFPEYIARSLETTQNEDELYDRLKVLPENLQVATLEAVLDGLTYEVILSREKPAIKATLSVPQEAKPTATLIETSITAEVDAPQHLPSQQPQVEPSDIPPIQTNDEVEAELKRLEKIVSGSPLSPSPFAERPILIHSTRQHTISDELEEANIVDSVVLLRIDRSYRFGITAEELYEATRGDWAMTPEKRRVKPRYAMAVVSFVIQEVYKIDDWFPFPASSWGDGRWRFNGIVASEKADLIGKSVQSYINRRSSNPVRYVNC